MCWPFGAFLCMHKCESLGGKFSKSKQAEQRLRFPKILGMKSLSHMEDIMLCYTKTTAGREPFSGCSKCQVCVSQEPLPIFRYPHYARRTKKIIINPLCTKAAVEIIPFGLFIPYLPYQANQNRSRVPVSLKPWKKASPCLWPSPSHAQT